MKKKFKKYLILCIFLLLFYVIVIHAENNKGEVPSGANDNIIVEQNASATGECLGGCVGYDDKNGKYYCYFPIRYNSNDTGGFNFETYGYYNTPEGKSMYCIHPGRNGPESNPNGMRVNGISTDVFTNKDIAALSYIESKAGNEMEKLLAMRFYLINDSNIQQQFGTTGPEGAYKAVEVDGKKVLQINNGRGTGGLVGVDDNKNAYTCQRTINSGTASEQTITYNGNEVLEKAKNLYYDSQKVAKETNNSNPVNIGNYNIKYKLAEDHKSLTVTLPPGFYNAQLKFTGNDTEKFKKIGDGVFKIEFDRELEPNVEHCFTITDQTLKKNDFTIEAYMPEGSSTDNQWFISYDVTEKRHTQSGSTSNLEQNTKEICFKIDEEEDCNCSLERTKIPSPLFCNNSTNASGKDAELSNLICGNPGDYEYDNSTYCDTRYRNELFLQFYDKTQVTAGRQFIYDLAITHSINTETKFTVKAKAEKQYLRMIRYNMWKQDYERVYNTIYPLWNKYLQKKADRESWLSKNEGKDDICENCKTNDPCNGNPCSMDDWYKKCQSCYGKPNEPCPADCSQLDCNNDGKIDGNDNDCNMSSYMFYNSQCEDCIECNDVCSNWISKEEVQDNYYTPFKGAYDEHIRLINEMKSCQQSPSLDLSFKFNMNLDYSSLAPNEIDSRINLAEKPGNGGSDAATTYKDGFTSEESYDAWFGILADGACNTDYDSLNFSGAVKPSELHKYESDGEELIDGYNRIKNILGPQELTEVEKRHAMKGYKIVEQNYYNDKHYYTEIITGNVTENNNGNTKKYIALPEYSYPVSFYLDTNSNIGKNKKTKYEVDVGYHLNSDDRYLKRLLNPGKSTYGCYVDVFNILYKLTCVPDVIPPDPQSQAKYKGLGFMVRNVDLTNLFPKGYPSSDPNVSQPTRMPGANWIGSRPEKVKNAIEHKGQNIFATGEEPQYEVILTPKDIRKIKDYNKDNPYTNQTIECTGLKPGTSCKSEFFGTTLLPPVVEEFKINNNIKVDDEGNYYEYGLEPEQEGD